MIETVVHITTLEQWRSVLDIWYEQGYQWEFLERKNEERHFGSGGRFLFLDHYITYSTSIPSFGRVIEYSQFMAQQKEDSKMETCYVTQAQLDLIKNLKSMMFPMSNLIDNQDNRYDSLVSGIKPDEELSILRYIGGDETVEFKVKESLYRLWRIDDNETKVYMWLNGSTPDWSINEKIAFTATLAEIRNWQTPAWSVEEVK